MNQQPSGRKPSARQQEIRELLINHLMISSRTSAELYEICKTSLSADDNEVRRALRSLKKAHVIYEAGRKRTGVGGNPPIIWKIKS